MTIHRSKISALLTTMFFCAAAYAAPNNGASLLKNLVKERTAQNAIFRHAYTDAKVAWLFGKCPVYKLMRVTAVLTANDDGTQALGKIENGQVTAMEPYLRNLSKHTKPGQDYIKDWIMLANLQLLQSGACFGLDVGQIKYVLEKNTALNQRECGDGAEEGQATLDLINQRAADTNSPYHDSVIIFFRWGKNTAQPAGQACSGVDSPYILMSGQYNDTRYIDGEVKVGSDQLTHEFGHFMGLVHTFTEVANRLAGIAADGNPKSLPFTLPNLVEMKNVSLQDLVHHQQEALDKIATWPYNFDQDVFGEPNLGIPDSYGIGDTPIDLGLGLPLIFGVPACSGSYDFIFTVYDGKFLREVKDDQGNVIWWELIPTAAPTTFEIEAAINDQVRGNIMSYWGCSPEAQTFSAEQVKRMQFVLANIRAALVSRMFTVALYPKKNLGELTKQLLPIPHPWAQRLYRSYLRGLKKHGGLIEPSPGTDDRLNYCLPDWPPSRTAQ